MALLAGFFFFQHFVLEITLPPSPQGNKDPSLSVVAYKCFTSLHTFVRKKPLGYRPSYTLSFAYRETTPS